MLEWDIPEILYFMNFNVVISISETKVRTFHFFFIIGENWVPFSPPVAAVDSSLILVSSES